VHFSNVRHREDAISNACREVRGRMVRRRKEGMEGRKEGRREGGRKEGRTDGKGKRRMSSTSTKTCPVF
jgi:hypothetical protein